MPSKPMINRAKRGPYDELWTPNEALDYLVPYIQYPYHIWEPCPGNGAIVRYFGESNTVATETDFFDTDWPNHADMIVTNPPFSKKVDWIRRCCVLGRPFALLLPVTTLGVRAAQEYLSDAEIVFLPRRIDFTGKKAPWFAVAWFTKGLNIGKQINFAPIC